MDDKTIEGLPVPLSGPQNEAAVSLVNANKTAEEVILRILDDLAEDPNVDKRWLATGRTDIEKGFMAVNRAIFKPARVSLPDEDEPIVETGWVIEWGDSPASEPLYYCPSISGDPDWTLDHLQAVRFARQEDAVTFADAAIADEVRICEHQWS